MCADQSQKLFYRNLVCALILNASRTPPLIEAQHQRKQKKTKTPRIIRVALFFTSDIRFAVVTLFSIISCIAPRSCAENVEKVVLSLSKSAELLLPWRGDFCYWEKRARKVPKRIFFLPARANRRRAKRRGFWGKREKNQTACWYKKQMTVWCSPSIVSYSSD